MEFQSTSSNGTDHSAFSDQIPWVPGDYRQYRPPYPEALFRYLASVAPRCGLAWDCATGHGQAAVSLAKYFDVVVATDANSQQLAKAWFDPKVTYRVSLAESTTIPDSSVDLVSVALALHWFDLDRFYEEVRRVVCPNGVLACWTYHQQTIEPGIDEVMRRFFHEILGSYWAPQIQHTVDGYRSLPFPFEEVTPPPFQIEENWDMDRFIRFVETWSASGAYRQDKGQNPSDVIRGELEAAWGNPGMERKIRWDLSMRVGRVNT